MDNTTTQPKTGEATGSTATDIGNDAFIQEMQSQLTAQSGAISSSNTNIESKIAEAIKGVQTANKSSAKGIESSYNRQIGETRETGSFQFLGAQEQRRGFATNVGVLKKINEDTDKNIRDLEQRKQELILQGDSATAEKVAAMQMKALEFKQEAEQNVFSNLLQMSNFGLSVGQFGLAKKQEERQQQGQDFVEKQAISNIALEFGIPVQEGDTIDTIAARAAPFADEERKLKLEQVRADIANSRAQTAKALQGDPGTQPFDALTNILLAEKIETGEVDASMLTGFTNDQRLGIMGARSQVRERNKGELMELASSAKTPTEFMEIVKNSSKIYNTDDVLEVSAGIKPKKSNTSFKQTATNAMDKVVGFLDPNIQANIEKSRKAKETREAWLRATNQ
jgi:hypothetical protein